MHWREALRSRPDYLPLLLQTAWVLATTPDATVRNGPQAVVLAERAAQLAGLPNPALLDVLAAAYAEAGRFSEATQAAKNALAMISGKADAAGADAIRRRLQLYEAGSAFHESKPTEPTREHQSR